MSTNLIAAMAEVARKLPADHGLRFYLADLLAGRPAQPHVIPIVRPGAAESREQQAAS